MRNSARLLSRPETGTSCLAPTNNVEQAVAEVWQEMRYIMQVGIFDNFFMDLNGSSLLATQMTAQLRARFQVELPVKELACVISAQLVLQRLSPLEIIVAPRVQPSSQQDEEYEG
jgi:hypothetical protein